MLLAHKQKAKRLESDAYKGNVNTIDKLNIFILIAAAQHICVVNSD